MFSISMEVTLTEGCFYIVLFWILSRAYNKFYKYFKSKSILKRELYSAVCNAHLQTLKSILARNVDVNIRIGHDRNTLLHYAPTAEITRELLSHGACIDAVNNEGMTPLFYAIIDNKGLAVVQELLQHGADINMKSNDGHTALHFVPCLTDKKGLAVVRELLKYGVNVNAIDNDCATPLFFAVMCETNLDIIKELLLHGADINARGRYPFTTRYFTPLDLAVDEEKIPYAKLIIKITLMKHFDKDFRKIIDLDSYIGSLDYSELATFFDSCIVEMNQMKKDMINSNHSFYEFVSKINDSENIKPLHTSKKITEETISTTYPLYCDVFWPYMKLCLERANLLNKLSELQIYVESDSLANDVNEKEVILNHDCMYKIGEYLSNDDLLNFISGFEKVLNSFQIFRTTLWN